MNSFLKTLVFVTISFFLLQNPLILKAQTAKLVGTSTLGGGSIFAIDADGSNLEKWMDLTTGKNPQFSELLDINGTLFGVTKFGGLNNKGTIFTLKNDGTTYTKIFDFNDKNGENPVGILTEINGRIWGVTDKGSLGVGHIYNMNLDGTDYKSVHPFGSINKDGYYIETGLTEHAGYLWGVTTLGGTNNDGAIYKLKIDGSEYTIAHNFIEPKGLSPRGRLLFSNGLLWGTTQSGGTNSIGVIYNIQPDGTGFNVVYNFESLSGINPVGNLIESNGKIWGLSHNGGSKASGTIFSIELDGTGFTKVDDLNVAVTGSLPNGGLQEINGKLWGVTSGGGTNSKGTIFSINTDGTSLTNNFNFGGDYGRLPFCNLIESNGKIWGHATYGGKGDHGVIFNLDLNGSNYNVVKHFYSKNGSIPLNGLIESNGKLWGVTNEGGSMNFGVIYSIDKNGTNYTIIHNFDNILGRNPAGMLLNSNGVLFGMTSGGGANDLGIIFTLNAVNNTFSKVLDFDGVNGSTPLGELIEYNNMLWGVTSRGGLDDIGIVFRINKDGTNLTKLQDFNQVIGAIPNGKLTLSNNKFWGMTSYGGASNEGTIYSLNTDGSDFAKEFEFGHPNGRRPLGNLIESNGKLWGLTSNGGDFQKGVIFSFNPINSEYNKIFNFSPSNGSNPNGSLTESNGKLWSTTSKGGTNEKGVIFSIQNDGTNYSVIQNLDPIGGLSESAPLLVLKGEQIFTFSPENKIYGDDQFTLSASTNNNTIDYTSLNNEIISISGNKAIIITSGTVTIKATQPENETFIESSTESTFDISNAPLFISVNNEEIYYGDTIPNFSLTYSGFVYDDSESDITIPSISTPALSTSAVGDYQILLENGNAENYTLTLQDASLSIIQAPLNIQADDQEVMYGKDIPELTMSFTGFMNDDTIEDITPPSISTSAVLGSSSGQYQIQLAGGLAQNYSLERVDGEILISKAPLIITADDKSMGEGDVVPELTMAFTGFALNDAEKDITLPEISTSGSSTSPEGKYEILLSGGYSDNYALELFNGLLSIEKVLGIEDTGNMNFTISPNPTNNYFKINMLRPNSSSLIRIYDVNGVLIKEFSNNSDIYNIQQLNDGIYSIVVISNGLIKNSKLLIKH